MPRIITYAQLRVMMGEVAPIATVRFKYVDDKECLEVRFKGEKDDVKITPRLPEVKYHCNACSGADWMEPGALVKPSCKHCGSEEVEVCT